MKKTNIKAIAATCYLLLLAATCSSQTQNPYWSMLANNNVASAPGNYFQMQPIVLPFSPPNYYGASNIENTIQNMIADASGNPLFFIVNGSVFDGTGANEQILTYNKQIAAQIPNYFTVTCYPGNGVGNPTVFYENSAVLAAGGLFNDIPGYTEVCVVPNPSNCKQFYVFTAGQGETYSQAGFSNGTYGAYQIRGGQYYPFYAFIDVTSGTPVLSTFPETNDNLTCYTPTSGGNCVTSPSGQVCNIGTPTTNNYNVFNLAPLLYSNTQPKSTGIFYAATPVIQSSSGAYNLVFESDGYFINVMKVTGSTPTAVSLHNSILHSSNIQPLGTQGEMEVVKLANGNFRVAISYIDQTNNCDVYLQDFDINGNPVSGSNYQIIAGGIVGGINTFVSGIELTADGNNILVNTSAGNVYYQTLATPLNNTTSSLVGLSPPVNVANSQIELNYLGSVPYMYFVGSSGANLVSLKVNGSPSTWTTWNTAAATFPSGSNYDPAQLTGTYPLPDQIDGGGYPGSSNQPPQCCYEYGKFNVNTPYTAPTGNVTWSNGAGNNPWGVTGGVVTVNANITVPAGTNLTVNGLTFKFTPSAQFIVNSGSSSALGGITKFNNCTLTVNNSCQSNVLWPGVLLMGNTTTTYPTQGIVGTSNYATMVLTNSEIEFAQTAVSVGDYTYMGGPILQAVNSTFINNYIGVNFHDYNGIAAYSQSHFKQCTFETNSAFIPVGIQPFVLASLTNNKPTVYFNGCTFIDVTGPAAYEHKYNGINATNSNVNVNTPSTFNALNYGIHMTSTIPGRTLNCSSNLFYNNITGIYLGTTDFFTVNSNTFKTCVFSTVPYSTGLYIDNSTGFDVKLNYFTQTLPNHPAGNSTFGIITNNTNGTGVLIPGSANANDNLIYKNTFNDIDYGCQALNQNYFSNGNSGVVPINDRGLQYQCNLFQTQVPYGILVQQGDISAFQGNPISGGANNQFNPSNYLTFYYDPQYTPASNLANAYLQYAYNTSTPNANPFANPSGYFKEGGANVFTIIPTNQNTCGNNPINPNTNPINNIPTNIGGKLAQVKTIQSTIDCGNTTALLAAVNTATNTLQVKNEILACAPKVSDAVLQAYVNNTTYSANDKEQVLQACSPLTPFMQNVVKNSTLPFLYKLFLDFYQFGTSPYGYANSEIHQLNFDADMLGAYLIRYYLNDTIDPAAGDSALKYIKLYEAEAGHRVRTSIAQKDTISAANYYDTLVTVEGVNSRTQLHSILRSLPATNQKAALQSNPAMVSQLQTIAADTSLHESSLMAIWLLRLVQDYAYNELHMLPSITSGARVMAPENQSNDNTSITESVKTQSPYKLGNYPNPFMGSTTLTAFLPKEESENAVLIVTDNLGREISRYTLIEGNNTVNFNTQGVSKGVLFYSLFINGTRTETKAMIKTDD